MTREEIVRKLTSRKFWLAVAAFIAAFVGTAQGFIPPEWAALMMALVAGIYAACEAYVDGANAKSVQTVNSTSVTATSTSQKAVEQALVKRDEQ